MTLDSQPFSGLTQSFSIVYATEADYGSPGLFPHPDMASKINSTAVVANMALVLEIMKHNIEALSLVMCYVAIFLCCRITRWSGGIRGCKRRQKHGQKSDVI